MFKNFHYYTFVRLFNTFICLFVCWSVTKIFIKQRKRLETNTAKTTTKTLKTFVIYQFFCDKKNNQNNCMHYIENANNSNSNNNNNN